MKKGRHIAWNTHLFLNIFLFSLFAFFSVTSFVWNEIGFGIACILFALLAAFDFFISPQYTIFTEESVEIVYCFRQRLCIPWCDVRNIYEMGSWVLRFSAPPHYVLAYPEKEKRLFFVQGEIPKTRRTRNLIESYYGKKID